MKCLNKVMLIGYVDKDPLMKFSKSGMKYSNFYVSTKNQWVDNFGNSKESTDSHNVNCFGKLAEYCEVNIREGSPVYVEGSLKINIFRDRNSIEIKTVSVNASNIVLIGDSGVKLEASVPAQSRAIPPAQGTLMDNGKVVYDKDKPSGAKMEKDPFYGEKMRENLSPGSDYDDDIPF